MLATENGITMSKIRAIDFAIHSDEEIASFLSTVDDAQIDRLEAAITAVGVRREEEKAKNMREEMEAIAAKYGTTISAAFATKIGAKVAPKFCNPVNPSETWTGRGRQPLWVTAWEAKHGSNRDALLIEPKVSEVAE